MPQHSWLRLMGLHHIYREKEPLLIQLKNSKTAVLWTLTVTEGPPKETQNAAHLLTQEHQDDWTSILPLPTPLITVKYFNCLVTTPPHHSWQLSQSLWGCSRIIPSSLFTNIQFQGSRAHFSQLSLSVATTTKSSHTRITEWEEKSLRNCLKVLMWF